MGKLNYALPIVLLSATLLTGGKANTPEPSILTWKSALFTSNMPNGKQVNSKLPLKQALWEDLFNKDPNPPRKPRYGGSRGNDVCPIAPAKSEGIVAIWSDRPLFIWRGYVERIEVRSHQQEQVLWSRTFRSAGSSALYKGEALQPEKTYDLVLFNQLSPKFVTFKVMPEKERNAIAAELARMEDRLKRNGANAETIALAKANYFAKRQLWSDVLQAAYSVENPSAALTQFKQTIPAKFCRS